MEFRILHPAVVSGKLYRLSHFTCQRRGGRELKHVVQSSWPSTAKHVPPDVRKRSISIIYHFKTQQYTHCTWRRSYVPISTRGTALTLRHTPLVSDATLLTLGYSAKMFAATKTRSWVWSPTVYTTRTYLPTTAAGGHVVSIGSVCTDTPTKTRSWVCSPTAYTTRPYLPTTTTAGRHVVSIGLVCTDTPPVMMTVITV